MLTNFENITQELSDDELSLVPVLVAGFKRHDKNDPIKAPSIVVEMNKYLKNKGVKIKMTEVRLRKIVNHIRSNAIIPLCSTSKGYFCSSDPEEIKSNVQSLFERASSIRRCAEGLASLIPVHNL